jgi:hypothetical protein
VRPRGQLPLIREVQRWSAEGSYREAVSLAYTTAVREAELALRLTPAPGLTHPERLQQILDAGHVELARSLYRLYEIYRPIRYGPPAWGTTTAAVEDVIDLLQDVYGQGPMWHQVMGPARSPSPNLSTSAQSGETPSPRSEESPT